MMPIIRRLTAQGLHRRIAFDVMLAPITVVTGRNDAGKSTMLGAIRLGLEGPSGGVYPMLGRRPSYPWSVELRLEVPEGDVYVRRRYGSGKHHLEVRDVDGSTLKGAAAQQRIDLAFGGALRWSVGAFLAASPRKRLDYIAEALRPPSAASEQSEDSTKRAEAYARAGHLAGLDSALDSVDRASDLDRIVGTLCAGAAGAGVSPHRSLGEASATLRHPGLLTAMARWLLREGAAAPEEAAAWMPTIVGRIGDGVALADLAPLIEEVEADVVARRAAAGRIAKAVAQDQADEAARGEVMTPGTVATWRARQAELDEEIGDVRTRLGKAEALSGQRDLMEASIEILAARVDAARSPEALAVADAASRLRRLRGALEDLEDEIQRESSGEYTVEDIDGYAAIGARVSSLLDYVVGGDESGYHLPPAVEADASWLAALRLLVEDGWHRDPLVRARMTRLRALRRNITAAEAAEAVAVAKHAGPIEDPAPLEAELDEARAALAALDTQDTSALLDLLAGLEEERERARAHGDELNDLASDQIRWAQHVAEAGVASAGLKAMEGSLATLKARQARALQPLIEGLRQDVQAIAGAVLRDTVVDLDASGGGLEIRVTRDGIETPTGGSSSAHAVVSIALAIALLGRRGAWRGLIVDDMEALEDERLHALIEALLAGMYDGRVEQWIGAGVDITLDEERLPDLGRAEDLCDIAMIHLPQHEATP